MKRGREAGNQLPKASHWTRVQWIHGQSLCKGDFRVGFRALTAKGTSERDWMHTNLWHAGMPTRGSYSDNPDKGRPSPSSNEPGCPHPTYLASQVNTPPG